MEDSLIVYGCLSYRAWLPRAGYTSVNYFLLYSESEVIIKSLVSIRWFN
jgi:hypothetical protein